MSSTAPRNPMIMVAGRKTVRFIRSFDPGSGDYTRERKKYLKKKTVKQIGKEILALQKTA